jgi:hypothetical protein
VPVLANVVPDEGNWYFETSATAGEQAPLKSVNKDRLVSAAFRLGTALCAGAEDRYAWISLCQWVPNDEYGMEKLIHNTFQLAFTRFGVAVLRNWEEIFIPTTHQETRRPVLIYDYDAYCFLFCDACHFVRYAQAWTIFSGIFGVEPPPIAEPAPNGQFTSVHEYMALYSREPQSGGDPVRPQFQN